MVTTLRWTARLLGIVPVVIGWMFLIGEAITEAATDGEGVAVVIGLVALTAAAVAGWLFERAGGIAEVVVAFVFGVLVFVTAGDNRLVAALLLPLPWLLSGLLFLVVDWLERRKAPAA